MLYRNILSSILGFLLVISTHFICYASPKYSSKAVEEAKRSVVSVDRKIVLSAYTFPYDFYGNGVIIDKQGGYILTSGAVIGPAMIASYTITFFNGLKTKANVMYYDPWFNYAILKVDPSVIPRETKAIKLSNKEPIIGQSVFTIAKHREKKHITYSGKITDTNFNMIWAMPQQFICVSTTKKSSAVGSLIFNELGEAVALNCGFSDTINVNSGLVQIFNLIMSIKII